MNKVLYVGLDVHADTIAVAVADEGRLGEIRYFGTISNTVDSGAAAYQTLGRSWQSSNILL